MIADRHFSQQKPSAGLGSMTRRRLLVVAAAGLVAGCAPAHSTASASASALTPRPSPGPLAPTARITLANVTHMATLGVLATNDGRLRGAAWSPDGSLVAAGGQSDVHMWSTQTGREVGTWHGHTDQIYQIAWCAANSLLASASADGTVRLWNASNGTVVRVLGGPPDEVASVAWSPDGTQVVAGQFSGVVNLWDVHTGQKVATWSGPPHGAGNSANAAYAVYGVSWSPDGRRIVSTRYDGFVLVWEASSGRALATLSVSSQPNSVAWSPDGSTFSSSHDDGSVHLWDVAGYHTTSMLAARISDGWAFPMAWSPDGAILAVGRSTGLIQWYDTARGTELAAREGHKSGVWALGWAPNDLRVATASDDGTVRLWGAH